MQIPEIEIKPRPNEFNAYSFQKRASVVKAHCFENLSTRKMDTLILHLNNPDDEGWKRETKGWQSWAIINHLGLGKFGGIFQGMSIKEAIEELKSKNNPSYNDLISILEIGYYASLNNIELDEYGFPALIEFYDPILKFLKDGPCSEKKISKKLIDYFYLNNYQINQTVEEFSDNRHVTKNKLESYKQKVISDFERLDCIKKQNKIYSIEYRGKELLNRGIVLKENNLRTLVSKLERRVSRLDLIRVLGALSNLKLDFSFVHYTTNNQNSILNVTTHLKTFLKRNNIYDFDNQEFGGVYNNSTYFFTNDEIMELEEPSFYPASNDDNSPRMWFNGIDKNLIKPGDIFLCAVVNEDLCVFNLSDDFTMKSFLSKKGGPYEILKEESDKKYAKNVKIFGERLKTLNSNRYILLNSDYPDVNSILKREGFVYNNYHKYEYNNIEFGVLNEYDIFDNNYENIPLNFLNDDESSIIEFTNNYFSNDSFLELSSIKRKKNLKLENDYEKGILKVVDKSINKDVLTFPLEDILNNDTEGIYLVYNKFPTNHSVEYVLFDKLLHYSKPNFSLLSFFMLDKVFKTFLNIKMELVLDMKLDGNLLSCSLRLELEDEDILKKLFNLNVFNLSEYF